MDAVNTLAKFEVRSFARFLDNRGIQKIFRSPWICPCFLFSSIFNGLLFRLILWICVQNVKFVALPIC